MNNLDLYNKVRSVPQEATKPIIGGRLKGKSDINPMWRIKTLTEQFGPCGFGWKYTITKQWAETGYNGEVSAFVNIDLYIKMDGQWSEAIPGTGGSSFVVQEKNGMYTDDECYKKALTDAISVACKAIGMAADVYYANDRTKYDRPENTGGQPSPAAPDNRKTLPKEKFNEPSVMKWIYDSLANARQKGQRLSLYNLVTTHYKVSEADLQEISANYDQYRVNNNLP